MCALPPRFPLVRFGLVLGLLAVVGCTPSLDPTNDREPGTTDFASADFMNTSARGGGFFADAALPSEAANDQESGSAGGEEVQREIEEADLAKVVDGKLYLLNAYRGLRIVDVTDWANPQLQGRVSFSGQPAEMYVVNGLAVVIVRNWAGCRLDAKAKPTLTGQSTLYAISVADPAAPALLGTFDLEGIVTDSRRVGDVIYVAGYDRDPDYYYLDEPIAEDTEPGVATVRASSATAPADQANGFVASLSIADPADVKVVAEEDFTGRGEYIHATTEAVFVAGYSWSSGETTIQYVDISDPAGTIQVRGQAAVPGYLVSRFCLNAQGAVLRVISETPGEWEATGGWYGRWIEPAVKLFTFDLADPDNITRLGQVEIIEGETLRAATFTETLCYAVTYEQTDPVWVIDLADPADPKIAGSLQVPGWSTHLEQDGDLLIAMGVDDQAGWRAAVSLFDVSDPTNPTKLAGLSLGSEYSSSEANYDDKAFKVIPAAKLVLVPFDTWNEEGPQNRLQLVSYDNDTLTKLATLSHRGSVQRSGVDLAAQVLWLLSQQALQTVDISTPTKPVSLAALALADNVIAYRAVGDYGLRVVNLMSTYWCPSVEVQVVASADPNSAGSLAAKGFDLYAASLVIVSSDLACLSGSTSEGKMRLVVLDLSKLPELTVSADKTFDFASLGGWGSGPVMPLEYYGYDYGYGSGYRYGYGYSGITGQQENPLVLANGSLVFTAFSWGSNWHPQVSLKAVSLADPTAPEVVATLDLSPEESASCYCPAASGNTVYGTISRAEEQGWLDFSPPRLQFYLKTIDLTDPARPVQADLVNVPGVVVHLAGSQVYTLDPYWLDGGWTAAWRLCGLTLRNGQAVLDRTVDLPEGMPGEVLADGTSLIVRMGSSWYEVMYGYDGITYAAAKAASSSKARTCDLGSTTLLNFAIPSPAGIRLIETKNLDFYASLVGLRGGRLLAQASTVEQVVLWTIGEDGTLALGKVADVPGWVSDVSWSAAKVDLACGMGGVATVPLP